MGMFDWVNYEMDCPICGEKLDNFQTKDTDCSMDTVEFWETLNFYSDCGYCGAWVEFRLNIRPNIGDYKMKVEKKERAK